jgi:two-component system, NarL family, response regulator DegU
MDYLTNNQYPSVNATTAGAARHDLTHREHEVLVLVTEGLPNRNIARRLNISESTVKNHLRAIFGKLNVSDRTQAALFALRRGLAV